MMVVRLSLIVIVVSMFTVACRGPANARDDDQVARGRQLAIRYGCPACHDIAGMPSHGFVGPPLREISRRSYLAGKLWNTPQNMVSWIRSPRSVSADTAMPDLGVTEEDGRAIVEMLYRSR